MDFKVGKLMVEAVSSKGKRLRAPWQLLTLGMIEYGA